MEAVCASGHHMGIMSCFSSAFDQFFLSESASLPPPEPQTEWKLLSLWQRGHMRKMEQRCVIVRQYFRRNYSQGITLYTNHCQGRLAHQHYLHTTDISPIATIGIRGAIMADWLFWVSSSLWTESSFPLTIKYICPWNMIGLLPLLLRPPIFQPSVICQNCCPVFCVVSLTHCPYLSLTLFPSPPHPLLPSLSSYDITH